MALVAGLALAAAMGPAWAQGPLAPRQPPPAEPAPPPTAEPEPIQTGPYELRPIREIEILEPVLGPDGRPGEQRRRVGAGLEQLVRNQLRTLEGRPFRESILREDVTNLNRLGRFRTIDSAVRLVDDGSVVVVFTLLEQPLVQDVQTVGNRELSDQELLQQVEIKPGTPVDRFQIDRAARAIEGLYRDKGYYNVKVQVDERELEESAIVLYRIVEGQRVRVTGVAFEGNNSFTARELRSAIKTTIYVPVFEKGPLDDDVLREDVNSLARFYKDRGYLDARTSARVQPSPNGREAIVTFQVDEGPLYTLRRVEVLYTTPDAIDEYRGRVLKDPRASVPYLTPEQMAQIGRRPLSAEQVAGLMPIKPGDAYGEDKIRRGLRAIEEAYGKLGFVLDEPPFESATVRVTPREIRDETRPEVDLVLFIAEGRPTTTGQIVIGGNELTKQQVLLRQIDLKPGRPLDYGALQESRRRLENLRLFEPGSVRLRILPPEPETPDTRDVYVEVRETNTGEFNLGAALSSDAGVIGQISLVQRNFDLFDTPAGAGDLAGGRSFRGAGQRFEISAQPGDRFQDYRISLTEPYFLETDYSVGGAVYYRLRSYSEYDEERYGGSASLGRRFGPVWEGSISFRNEWVRLGDFENDPPVDFTDAAERTRITGLGVKFARTTTDDRFRPSKGSRLEFAGERVGLLGQTYDFTKLQYSYSVFLNVYESFLGYKTILKLTNEVAIIPEGQDSAPTYERLYLGGRSFRGFGTRAVSPLGRRRDGSLTDEPVGGSFSFFLGAEIQQPIYEDIFSVVAFIDSGTVDEDVSLARYRVSIGTGIRVYVPQLSPIPLAFDFGFPIIREDGDRRRLFTFSVDIPF